MTVAILTATLVGMAAKDDLRASLRELLGVALIGQTNESLDSAADRLTEDINALVEEHVSAHDENSPHRYADGSSG